MRQSCHVWKIEHYYAGVYCLLRKNLVPTYRNYQHTERIKQITIVFYICRHQKS